MVEPSKCDRYKGDFPKLSKTNSVAINGRVFYFKKSGSTSVYVFYDYKTKIKVLAMDGKEKGIEFLQDKDLGFLDGT